MDESSDPEFSGGVEVKERVVNKKFIAAALGNWLEWYDFGVYAALADLLGKHFFPDHDASVQVMQSFLAFAAGYISRPVGGILIGVIADRLGRKCGLWTSILLMMFPTFFIGCLPTYQTAGWLSTILLVTLRLLQGIAIGGEYVSALVFSMEHAQGRNKTISGALMSVSVAVGTFSGFGVVVLMRHALSTEAMASIGWRICFWLGLVVGIVGIFLRRQVADPREFIDAQQAGQLSQPIWAALWTHCPDILLMIGVEAITPVTWYQNFIWIQQVYEGTLTSEPAMPGGAELNTFMQLAPSLFMVGIAACRSDFNFLTSVRRGMALLAALAVPAYLLFDLRTFWAAFLSQSFLALGGGLIAWGNPYLMHSSFPVDIRVMAMGISYNLSAALLGGPTPYICSQLVVHFGVLSASIWLLFIASLSYTCVCLLLRRQGRQVAANGDGLQSVIPRRIGNAA
ncbi:proP [Symbiodinium sp. CCMP2592]|nr:proP [Symbiodinium sp. CCMP2592]